MKNLDGDDVVDVFCIYLGDTQKEAWDLIPRGPKFGSMDEHGVLRNHGQVVGLVWSWRTAERNGCLSGIHADKVVVRASGHVTDARRSMVANVASALNDEVYWKDAYFV